MPRGLALGLITKQIRINEFTLAMNSVTKHIGYLGLLVAFTLSNLGASHAGDLTGYDADGDGLIDYLDEKATCGLTSRRGKHQMRL